MDQYVNMIFHAIDCDGLDSLVAADAGHVRPETRLNFFCDHPAAVFGAEDYVGVNSGECVGHDWSSAAEIVSCAAPPHMKIA